MPEKRLSTVGNFPTTAEAHAARLLLASQGIEAIVVDEMLVGNFWYLGNAVGGVKLQVDSADDLRARQLLADEAAPPAGDSGPSHAAAWICSQCRERVPANFEVCWACGRQRGPGDADEVPPPDPQTTVRPKPPAAEILPLPVRESRCSACGAALLSASALCPRCGATAACNPFEAPLHPTLAAIKPASGVLRQQRQAADALAQRAWLAAILGSVCLPPLLNIYSVVLLVILAERHERLSPRMFRRVAWAWAMNLTMLLIMGVVLLNLLR